MNHPGAHSPYRNLHPSQRRFLAAFEVCGSIIKAARWAKLHRCNHYDWLRDEDYALAFAVADARSARTLEDEAVRRAHEGIRKPVWYKGKVVGYQTEYDNALLYNLLKANNPDKFKDRSASDINLKGSLSIDILREIRREVENDHPRGD